MYGYWLQEKDHYAADRAAADAITEQFPEVAAIARANRAFLGRAVRFAARQGIRQFLDLGSGLPISPNVHEIAQSVQTPAPGSSTSITIRSCWPTPGRCWPPTRT